MSSLGTQFSDYFDAQGQGHEELFSGVKHIWEVLPKIAGYLKKN